MREQQLDLESSLPPSSPEPSSMVSVEKPEGEGGGGVVVDGMATVREASDSDRWANLSHLWWLECDVISLYIATMIWNPLTCHMIQTTPRNQPLVTCGTASVVSEPPCVVLTVLDSVSLQH